MYRNFKSQLGYENGENKIDSYGVDHRNFSLRDEISYQMARTNRENELIKNYNNQGITQDYPQYSNNFWGGNPANNYGFGSSNISDNIENVTNSLKNQNYGLYQNSGTIAPVPQTNQQQNTAFGQSNNILTQNNNTSLNQTPTPWNTEANKMQNQTTFSWNNNPNISMTTQHSGQNTTFVQDNTPINTTNNPQQSSLGNNIYKDLKSFADATETAVIAGTEGATLGNFDEIMGAATAATTLNKDNYTMGRDAIRQYQKKLQEKSPIIYGSAEFIGAIAAIMHCPESVLTKMKISNPQLFNAISDTFVASSGYAENWKDFFANLPANGLANAAGYNINKLKFTRGISRLINNKVTRQGINYIADKTKNMFYTKDDNEK